MQMRVDLTTNRINDVEDYRITSTESYLAAMLPREVIDVGQALIPTRKVRHL